MTRVPITDASVSDTSTNFLEYCPTAWATFRSLKPYRNLSFCGLAVFSGVADSEVLPV